MFSDSVPDPDYPGCLSHKACVEVDESSSPLSHTGSNVPQPSKFDVEVTEQKHTTQQNDVFMSKRKHKGKPAFVSPVSNISRTSNPSRSSNSSQKDTQPMQTVQPVQTSEQFTVVTSRSVRKHLWQKPKRPDQPRKTTRKEKSDESSPPPPPVLSPEQEELNMLSKLINSPDARRALISTSPLQKHSSPALSIKNSSDDDHDNDNRHFNANSCQPTALTLRHEELTNPAAPNTTSLSSPSHGIRSLVDDLPSSTSLYADGPPLTPILQFLTSLHGQKF